MKRFLIVILSFPILFILMGKADPDVTSGGSKSTCEEMYKKLGTESIPIMKVNLKYDLSPMSMAEQIVMKIAFPALNSGMDITQLSDILFPNASTFLENNKAYIKATISGSQCTGSVNYVTKNIMDIAGNNIRNFPAIGGHVINVKFEIKSAKYMTKI